MNGRGEGDAVPAETRRDRAVMWLLARIPTPVLLNPERIAIKSGVAIIGLAALIFVRPTSLNALLPHWVVYLWGVTWMLGGVFGLVGYWRNSRAVEMAGHRMIILGALVYAVAIGFATGTGGLAAIILVAVIVGCSLLRLLIAAGSKLSRQRRR